MNCAIHDQSPAVATCSVCGRAICDACLVPLGETTYCKACLAERAPGLTRGTGLRKSPALAGLLSLMPGLGQIYVGYYTSGFVNILTVCALIVALSSSGFGGLEPFLGVFLSFFWLFNIVDAVRKANLVNRHGAGEAAEALPSDSPLFGGILLLVFGLLLTLRITLGIELAFLEKTWPLGVLGTAVYLLWRYARLRRELRERNRDLASSAAYASPRSTPAGAGAAAEGTARRPADATGTARPAPGDEGTYGG